jgi:hypothetical protein
MSTIEYQLERIFREQTSASTWIPSKIRSFLDMPKGSG